MKRLLIITSCLFICIACFAGNVNTKTDSTIITYNLNVGYQNGDSVTIYLSDVYTSTKKYVYGDKDGNHGGKNTALFNKQVVLRQGAEDKNIVVGRDSTKGPYITIKSICNFDSVAIKFPFAKTDKSGSMTDPDQKDFLCFKIKKKDYCDGCTVGNSNSNDGKPNPEDGLWKKIKSRYSPYWIIILIDWLVILCIVVLVVYLFYIRNIKTVNEPSDYTQEKVKDEDKKEKGKQRRSQKDDNRDVQLEGFKNLIINEIENVIASQKNEIASLRTELLRELANFKEQKIVKQKNADKTNSSPNRTIVSSQSVSGIGTNSTNELDTREVDFQDGKMVIVKDSQYKYFRIFSEKGRFYYTQNPEYGIETWASDYNNLTDAMTIKNPYDSQNSRNIKIVERGKLTKVSDDTFEIAEKLVLEFI